MLGIRASRIAATSGAAPREVAGPTLAAQLSPEQRIARWRVLSLKETKAAAVAVLGQGPYQSVVQEIPSEGRTSTLTSLHRICHGEGVGRELPQSKSTGAAPGSRATCKHDDLRKLGNNSLKWWCCTMCGAIFERTGLDELPEEVPEEVLRAAAQGEDPLTRWLARSLLERDVLYEQALLMMGTEEEL
jgi:hypothetical protein